MGRTLGKANRSLCNTTAMVGLAPAVASETRAAKMRCAHVAGAIKAGQNVTRRSPKGASAPVQQPLNHFVMEGGLT